MSEWKRVPSARPCPVCGRKGWCSVSADGAVCNCRRNSGGPTYSLTLTDKNGVPYHVHRLAAPIDTKGYQDEKHAVLLPDQCLSLARKWTRNIRESRLNQLSEQLGVSVDALKALRIGWVSAGELEKLDTYCKGAGAWTYPTRDHNNNVVGIGLRTPDGFKYRVTGCETGIVIPQMEVTCPALIVEGMSDLAAALTLGYFGVARLSNTCSADTLTAWCIAQGVDRALIVTDNDPDSKPEAQQATKAGAETLAARLSDVGVRVWVYTPRKHKDIRTALNAGVTKQNMDRALRTARPYRAQEVAA